MPRYDGSGPYGDGPRGRGLGPCGGNQPDTRYGFGVRRRGWFGRRGFFGGGRFSRSYTTQDEIADLEEEKSFLEKRLNDLKKILN